MKARILITGLVVCLLTACEEVPVTPSTGVTPASNAQSGSDGWNETPWNDAGWSQTGSTAPETISPTTGWDQSGTQPITDWDQTGSLPASPDSSLPSAANGESSSEDDSDWP